MSPPFWQYHRNIEINVTNNHHFAFVYLLGTLYYSLYGQWNDNRLYMTLDTFANQPYVEPQYHSFLSRFYEIFYIYFYLMTLRFHFRFATTNNLKMDHNHQNQNSGGSHQWTFSLTSSNSPPFQGTLCLSLTQPFMYILQYNILKKHLTNFIVNTYTIF